MVFSINTCMHVQLSYLEESQNTDDGYSSSVLWLLNFILDVSSFVSCSLSRDDVGESSSNTDVYKRQVYVCFDEVNHITKSSAQHGT